MPPTDGCWDGENFVYLHPTAHELNGPIAPAESMLDNLNDVLAGYVVTLGR